jgi:hypothetical protein
VKHLLPPIAPRQDMVAKPSRRTPLRTCHKGIVSAPSSTVNQK